MTHRTMSERSTSEIRPALSAMGSESLVVRNKTASVLNYLEKNKVKKECYLIRQYTIQIFNKIKKHLSIG